MHFSVCLVATGIVNGKGIVFSPYMFHGNNDAIEKLLPKGVELPGNIEDECEKNNFLWGWHDKYHSVVETQNEESALVYTQKRLGAFLYPCTLYREYAMEYDGGCYRCFFRLSLGSHSV